MKNLIPLVFALIALTTIQCKDEFETISLDSNITITLPTDFILEDNNPDTVKKIYKANSSSDEIVLGVQNFSGFDTLSIEQKEKIVRINLEGFVKGVNGINIQKLKPQTIESYTQQECSMDIEKNEEQRRVYAKAVIKNSSIIILSYFTTNPPEIESVLTKDKIFQSIKID